MAQYIATVALLGLVMIVWQPSIVVGAVAIAIGVAILEFGVFRKRGAKPRPSARGH